MYLGTGIPGKENSKCKSPEVGIALVSLRNSRDLYGWSGVSMWGRIVAEVREAMGTLKAMVRTLVFLSNKELGLNVGSQLNLQG